MISGDRKKCLEASVNDYISKPFGFQRIISVLRRWLPHRVQGDEPKSDEPVEQNDPDHTVVFDATQLDKLSRTGDEQMIALMREIVELFIRTTPDAISNIRHTIENKDAAQLRFDAHKLKGMCLQIGATTMAELCRQLEDIGRSESVDESSASLVQQVDEQFELIKVALNDYLTRVKQ